MKEEHKFLSQMMLIVVLMQALAIGFIFWIFLEAFSTKEDEYGELMANKVLVRFESIFSGAIDDVYLMNNRSLTVRLESAVESHLVQHSDFPICVYLTAKATIDITPFKTELCEPAIVFSNENNVTNSYKKLTDEIVLSAGKLDMLSIRVDTYIRNKNFYGITKKTWGLLAGGLAGIAVVSILMVLIIHKNVLHRLIKKLRLNNANLEENNKLLEKSFIKEKRNLKILESLQGISEKITEVSPKSIEKIYIDELKNRQIFSTLVTHSKSNPSKSSCDVSQYLISNYDELSAMVLSYGQTVSILDIGSDDNFLSTTIQPIVAGYLIGLCFEGDSPPLLIWVNKEENEIDELVFSFFENLAEQYIRYKKLYSAVANDVTETLNKLSSKEGQMPISQETVYVEYKHPESLIYNSKRQELKKRISLTKLLSLFPEHLIQINKSYLVNPKFIVRGANDIDNEFLRVKVGRAVTRLKVGKTFLPNIKSLI